MSAFTPRKGGVSRMSVTPSRSQVGVRSAAVRETPAKHAMKDQGEEGITVAIRMRPLNTRESGERRTWRVLPKYHSVTQTTSNGQPLPERVMGRTFFTFDKTFGEETTTKQVYDAVAKGIVDSVVNGLNGTIFAYGQTSSGKTFTMQGSGSIEEGSVTGGGVVHMAANDIFSYVSNNPDRVFLVRASFVEIYNEEVRDLLGGNESLQIREDPTRGVFVNANEELASDFRGLLEILFKGEKNRAVAATGMNERSSRSHTIFRITIESRNKELNKENDPNGENLSDDDDDDDMGAVRISTLNLVDLAGSESVRHTGNTGDRLKEGAKINQSLLTLSRVIVGLGQPNQTHINFRDSKLTRLLQPSLSGNARMAVVCCATPSELYLEETRSTLQFASRAKLVKTNAQVNEVIDDRSMIKKLQRELAEAKKSTGAGNQTEQLRVLETQAANAGIERQEAVEKLKRLKDSILNSGALFDVSNGPLRSSETQLQVAANRKRRLSDGGLNLRVTLETPAKQSRGTTPNSAPGRNKFTMMENLALPELAPVSELDLMRQAIKAKGTRQRMLEVALHEKADIIEAKGCELSEIVNDRDELRVTLQATTNDNNHFRRDMDMLKSELEAAHASVENLQEHLNREIEAKMVVQEELAAWKSRSKEDISSLEIEKDQLKDSLDALGLQKESEINELEARLADALNQLDTALGGEKSQAQENVRQAFELAQLTETREKMIVEREEDKQKMQNLSSEVALLMGLMKDTSEEKQGLKSELLSIKKTMESEVSVREQAQTRLAATEEELERRNQDLADVERVSNERHDKLEAAETRFSRVEEELSAAKSSLDELISELKEKDTEISELKGAVDDFETSLEEISTQAATLEKEKESLTDRVLELSRERDASIAATVASEADLASTSAARDSIATELSTAQEELKQANQSIEQLECRIMVLRADFQLESSRMEEEKAELLHESREGGEKISALEDKVSNLTYRLENTRKDNQELTGTRDKLSSSVEYLKSKVASLESERNAAQAQTTQLREQLIATRIEFDSLEQSVEAMDDMIVTRDGTISKLKDDGARLSATSAEHVATIERLTIERDATKVQTDEAMEALASEVEGLKNDITSKDELISECEETISDLQEQVSRLESSSDEQKAILQKEVEDLRLTVLSKDDEIVARDGTISTLQDDGARLSATSAEHVATIEKLTIERDATKVQTDEAMEALTSEVEGLKNDITSKDELISECEETISDLQEQVSQLESSSDEQKATLQKEVEDLRLTVSTKDDEIVARDGTISTLQDDGARLSATSAEHVATIEKLTIERDATKVQTDEAMEALTSEVEGLKNDITSKDELIAECEETISDLQEQVSQLESSSDEQKATLQKEVEDLRLTVISKDDEIVARDGTISTLQDDGARLSATSAEHVATIEQLTIERDATKVQTDEAMEALTSEVEGLKNDITSKNELIAECEETISDLQEQVSQLESSSDEQKATLQKEVEDLRLTVISKDDEIVARDGTISTLQDDGARLSATSAEHVATIEQLTIERDATKVQTDEAMEALTSEVEGLKNDITSKDELIAECEETISDLQEQVSQLESSSDEQKATLQKEVEDLRLTVISKDDEIVARDGTISTLQDDGARLSATSAEHVATIEQLTIERDATKVQTDEAMEALTSEVEGLKNDITSKDELIAECEETISDLQEQVSQLESSSDEQKATLQKEVEDLRLTVSTKDDEIVARDGTISTLQDDGARLSATTAEHVATIEQLTIERDATKVQTDEAMEALASEVEGLKNDITSKDELISEFEETISDLQEQVSQLESSSDEQKATLQKEVEDLRLTVISKDDEIVARDGTISTLQDDGARLSATSAEHVATIEKLTIERDATKVQTDEAMEALTSEVEGLKNDITSKDELIAECEETISDLQEQVSQLESSSDEQKATLQKEVEDLRLTVISKDDEIVARDGTISTLQDDGARLSATSAEHVATIEQLTIERDATKVQTDEAMEALTSEVEGLKNDITSKDELIAECEETISDLQEQVSQLESSSDEQKAILQKEVEDLRLTVISKDDEIVARDGTISTLQDDGARLSATSAEHVATIEQLTIERDATKVQTDEAMEALMSKVEGLKNDITSKDELIAECEETISDLQEQVSQLESSSGEQKATLQKEVEDLRLTVSTKDDEIVARDGTISTLQDDGARLSATSAEHVATIEQLTIERDATKVQTDEAMEALTSEVEGLKNDITSKDELISEFEETISDLQEQVSQLERKVSEDSDAMYIVRAKGEAAVSDFEIATEVLKSDLLDSKSELAAKNQLIEQQSVVVRELKERLTELEAAVAENIDTIECLRSTRDSSQSAYDGIVDGLKSDIVKLENIISSKESELEVCQDTITEMRKCLSALETQVEERAMDLDQLNSDCQAIKMERESTIFALTSQINDLKTEDVFKSEAIAQLEKDITEFKEQMSNAGAASAQHARTIKELSRAHDVSVDSLKKELNEKKELLLSREEDFINCEAVITDLRERLSQAETRNNDLSAAVKQHKADYETTSDMLLSAKHELETELRLAMQSVATSDNLASNLQAEIVEQKAVMVELRAKQEKSKACSDETIETLNREIRELRSAFATKETTMAEYDTVISELRERLQDAEIRFSEQAALVADANSQRDAIQGDLDSSIQSKMKLEAQVNTLSLEKQNLTEQLTAAERQSQGEKETIMKLASLEQDKCELAQLLATANESVNEAREAALLADDELVMNERKLEETIKLLSQRERELEESARQVLLLESQLEASMEVNGKDKLLLTQVEALEKEKLHFESLLLKESQGRADWEQEHKRRMGDEQRSLIQQAEQEMSSLRIEIGKLKSALTGCETEVYAFKQENEELLDETKCLEAKLLESQNQLSVLKEGLLDLKSAKCELEMKNKRLSNTINTVEKRRGEEDQRSRKEVAKLTAELSRFRAAGQDTEQRLMDLEQRHQRMESECVKAQLESQAERKRRLSLETHAQEMQSQAQLLQQELSEKSVSIANKENAANSDAIDRLHRQLKDLQKESDMKDVRIKKLEKVRLTKEQCAALKKLKTENQSFREKLAEMEKENGSLRSQGAGNKMEDRASQEIASLRFAKEALETKLRKYLSYCKALESDKTHIIDALRSRKRSVVDDDFAGAVVSLCDQLTSLEEECDVLSNAEGRVSSYVVEIEKLRESIRLNESETDQAKQKIAELVRSETELKTKLQKAEDRNASLRDEREKLRSLSGSNQHHGEPKKSGQVKYLEKENLQLMLDLKTTKKQLQTARVELDNFRMKAWDEDTDDLTNYVGSATRDGGAPSGASILSKSTEGSALLSPLDKENKYVGKLPDGNKVSDSAKQQRLSRAKSSNNRMRESNHQSAGLGEAGIDDENTGECRQS